MAKKFCQTVSLSLDLFTLPISLFFQGNKKRFTYFGTIFSLFMYSFLLLAFFESDFYNKINPIIIKQNKLLPHANRISFDESKVVTFSVEDNQGNSIYDPSLFSFQFVEIHEKVNSTTGLFQYTSLDYKKFHLCEVNDTKNNSKLFDELSPVNSYCLDNKKFSVEGGWNENDVQFIYIALSICNNATSPIPCSPIEKIRRFFDESPKFLCLQYHSAQVDFYDYKDPIKVTYTFGMPQINFNSTKKNFIYLKEVILQSDNGWLFSDVQEYKDFAFDRVDTDWLPRVDDRVFIVQLYASQNQEMDSRRYQKLPEVIASIIGMSKLYVIFFGFFVNFVNEFQTMKTILRKLKINRFGKPSKKVRLSKFTNEMRKSSVFYLGSKKSVFLKQNIVEDNEVSKIIINEKKIQKADELNKNFENVKAEEREIPRNNTVGHISMTSIPMEIEQKNLPYESFVKSSLDFINSPKLKGNGTNRIPLEELKFKIELASSNPSPGLKLQPIPNDVSQLTNETKNRLCKKLNDDQNYDFSFSEYFMSFFLFIFKKTEQQKMIDKLKRTYTKRLDLIKILVYLKELKALKRILFDEDQKVIFDFINKPSVETNEEETNKRKIQKKQLRKEKFLASYSKIMQRMNDVDARLFAMADENIEKGE